MPFFKILETLLIGPLKLVFEYIFTFAHYITGNPAIAIIMLSLAMNLLVLPLYRRADAMQEQARDVEEKLRDGVDHIKKTFSGDERMMMLQTYYRQNNYKPTDVLKGSISLLLEIPFFMAAYQFLSTLPALKGAKLGPIADLGAPDGLLLIGGIALNLLPILMTLINVISSAIYLKGFPLKTKIQLYGIAIFFLVFLYKSPSGLVFYWTLNNVFSLIKNVFYKLKNPKKVILVLVAALGACAILGSLLIKNEAYEMAKSALWIIGLALQLPWIWKLLVKTLKLEFKPMTAKPDKKLFVLSALLLTVVIGLLIPSNVINASPTDYVDVTYFYHPLWFMISAFAFAAGTFLIWFNVFYWLASDNGKVIFERALFIMSICAVVNYMFFGTKLGMLTNKLQYLSGFNFTMKQQTINFIVILALSYLLFFIVTKWSKQVKTVLITGVLAVFVMASINGIAIGKTVKAVKVGEIDASAAKFNLSKNGQNVVVIMLDRGMAEYVPYIFNEVEGLDKKYQGFTFYNNTISFGGHTNMAVPALMGGYEYTPVELNKRDAEELVKKHNESLLVMPVLFSQNGFDVTVCDAPYANYQNIPDMSIYDDYEGISTYLTEGAYGNSDMKEAYITSNNRNMFAFAYMKTLPLFMQSAVYGGGGYHETTISEYTSYVVTSMTTSQGYKQNFMEPFEVLRNLDNIAQIKKDDSKNFLFLYNDAPHEPMMMQEPQFVPSGNVDNTEYEKSNPDRFTLNGKKINIKNEEQLTHYQSNAASLVELGNWFDWLREEGVYDNTKIIIVSDHGYYLNQTPELIHGGDDMSNFFPLFMVKDFNSKGAFTTSNEFMTNADVPTIATDGTIANPVNPFTGKLITSDEKYAHDQMIMLSHEWNPAKNNGNTFKAGRWAAITNDIWDRNDWEIYGSSIVLKEHELP